ncbi:hypothetical protein HMPREF9057_02454 [Actinomyces sp. oral taxon 171 str. F0337]|nr:hypothetical protein HMPREF9057_02454 [Actinomyces sp. oral taxon 171 str. F0337]
MVGSLSHSKNAEGSSCDRDCDGRRFEYLSTIRIGSQGDNNPCDFLPDPGPSPRHDGHG